MAAGVVISASAPLPTVTSTRRLVPVHDAARRVKQIHVREATRLGVKRALHTERPEVTLLHDGGPAGDELEANFKRCRPTRGTQLRHGRDWARQRRTAHAGSNSTGNSQVTNTMQPSGLVTACFEPGGLTTSVPFSVAARVVLLRASQDQNLLEAGVAMGRQACTRRITQQRRSAADTDFAVEVMNLDPCSERFPRHVSAQQGFEINPQ